ncbi:MAG: rod shape-determining protein MreC [Clostridiales bacterium]|nr:rod shape-determining protein MreC [Clostridiales bacterium]HBM79454.1 rod shape-determining protein MreC [Clostridiaceae bacterium]
MRRILQNRLLTIVIVLSLIFVVFIGLTATRSDRAGIFEGVVGDVLNPVQKYLYMGGQRINNFFEFIVNISSISKENESLKKKVTELQNSMADYETMKTENQKFKDMLKFRDENKSYSTVAANVIGKGSGNWFDIIIINKGTNQGIKKYYPVVAAQGLVGQVTKTGPNWSEVMSIVNESSRIRASLSRTDEQGIIQGMSAVNGEKNCKIMYLKSDSDIKKGDSVVTSGMSKFFPKNIMIGTIEDVSDDSNEFAKSAIIKPSVDFTKIREVFVVTNSISKDDYPDEATIK